MGRIAYARRLIVGLAILGSLVGVGCSGLVNILALPAIFLGGDKIDPKVKLLKDGRASAKVLVLSFADSNLRWGNDSIDEDLTTALAAELSNEGKFKLVPERLVRQYRDLHPRWESKPLQTIGEALEADYIIFVEVTEFATTDPKCPLLYQGRTKVNFKVHDVRKDRIVFTDAYSREYPSGRPLPVSEIASQETFRAGFIAVMAKELSWNVVARPTGEVNRDPW